MCNWLTGLRLQAQASMGEEAVHERKPVPDALKGGHPLTLQPLLLEVAIPDAAGGGCRDRRGRL